MPVLSGLDRLISSGFEQFKGKSIGVVCHQASVAKDCVHILDHMLPKHRSGDFEIKAAFGPQHGIWGHTQDNMIEWEGYLDARTGLRFFSLYGEFREPSASMLEGIEELVFDVQDVGARYYTFIWTLANCMKACEKHGIPVTVLDRPNPIGGLEVEDLGWSSEYQSFVGLYQLPVRHGLTVGEIGQYLKEREFPNCELNVVWAEGWERGMYFDETDLQWTLPSPNMPTCDTAVVYPGQCLLEGTQLSEGRGTTKPFEIFGAPFIDGWEFCRELNTIGLKGCVFRPVQFLPTFQKSAGEVCQGAQIHVLNRQDFRPVETSVAILYAVRKLYGDRFAWQNPPYEYEEILLPIDILSGGSKMREMVDESSDIKSVLNWVREESAIAVDSVLEFRHY